MCVNFLSVKPFSIAHHLLQLSHTSIFIRTKKIFVYFGGVQWLRGPNFAFFWPPPTYSGQTWTFEVPPTPCPRGQFQNLHPQTLKCNHQHAVHFYQNYEGINMIMACKIKLYYSESDLKYMSLLVSRTIDVWSELLTFFHFKLIFFENINMTKPILVPE